MASGSARDRILKLFLGNVGRVISKDEISQVAGITEWARRVRELRNEYGYQIKSHKDLPGELKPGQYILVDPEPLSSAKERKITKAQYYRILNRDRHICKSCGGKPGDPNPIEPSRTIRLVVDHVHPISAAEQYGIDPYSDENLQTLCDFCNEGKWNKYSGVIGEAKQNLVAMVRHAPVKEQKEVFEMLKEIFEL